MIAMIQTLKKLEANNSSFLIWNQRIQDRQGFALPGLLSLLMTPGPLFRYLLNKRPLDSLLLSLSKYMKSTKKIHEKILTIGAIFW